MSSVQSQIQQDWNNREFVEVIASSIKKIAEFLNAFDLSARSRLAVLNQKLTYLERQVEYIEARVLKNWQQPLWFILSCVHLPSQLHPVTTAYYGGAYQLAIVPGLYSVFTLCTFSTTRMQNVLSKYKRIHFKLKQLANHAKPYKAVWQAFMCYGLCMHMRIT